MDGPSKKIRLGEAAAAIGSTAKAVGQWISRYGDRGVKPTAEQTGTWREFSFGDVAALSITKYLVDLGMPAYGAFVIAMRAIEQRWPNLFSVDDPQWTVNQNNMMMFFYIDRDGNWGVGSYERSELRGLDGNGRVIVLVTLTNVIWDAFRALEEMGHTLPKCDDAEFRRSVDAERERRSSVNEQSGARDKILQQLEERIEHHLNTRDEAAKPRGRPPRSPSRKGKRQ